MKNQWELVVELGYTFEFEYKKDPMIRIKIYTMDGKKDAWNKLEELFK